MNNFARLSALVALCLSISISSHAQNKGFKLGLSGGWIYTLAPDIMPDGFTSGSSGLGYRGNLLMRAGFSEHIGLEFTPGVASFELAYNTGDFAFTGASVRQTLLELPVSLLVHSPEVGQGLFFGFEGGYSNRFLLQASTTLEGAAGAGTPVKGTENMPSYMSDVILGLVFDKHYDWGTLRINPEYHLAMSNNLNANFPIPAVGEVRADYISVDAAIIF
jgi:hypothetical protein